MAKKKYSLLEQLSFCTTRIEAIDYDGNVSYGTGMFYQIANDPTCPHFFIITNKHVACNQQRIRFTVSKADSDGNPLLEVPYMLTLEGEELQFALTPHWNNEVDLCAIWIQIPLRTLYLGNANRYFIALNKSNIPNQQTLQKLNGVEEILMVGYPNSLWDENHNMPLVRRGITASWPCLDYNGKKEFVIDCACYPGSSGSPVFICNEGPYSTKDSLFIAGSRVWLLGNLWGGPIRNVQGEIVVETDVKRLPNAWTKTNDMLNLGFVVRSERILELEEYIIKERLAPNQ